MKYVTTLIIVIALAVAGWWFVAGQDKAFAVIIDQPKAGDVYDRGQSVSVLWHSYNFNQVDPQWIANTSISFILVPENQTPEAARNSATVFLSNDLPLAEKGSFSVTIPRATQPGRYKISMSLHGVGSNTPNALWGLVYSSGPIVIN